MILPVLVGLAVVVTLVAFGTREERARGTEELFQQVSTGVFELTLLGHEVAEHPEGSRAARQWLHKHAQVGERLNGLLLQVGDEPGSARMQRGYEALGHLYRRLVARTEGVSDQIVHRRRERIVGQMLARAQALIADTSTLLVKLRQQQREEVLRVRIAVIVLVGMGAILLGSLTVLVGRSVLEPLQLLRRGTERIGAGDLEHRVGSQVQDEVGDLARAFDRMTEQLKRVTASRAELEREIRAREQAEAREARFGRILNSSSNEIYVFDAETLHFTEVNEGARMNLGYRMEELRALTPLDIKPGHTAAEFAELLGPLREGERQSLLFETRHRRKDGTCYPVEVRLQLMHRERPPVFVAVIQDISERQAARRAVEEANQRLEASNKELQDFAYLVSHDLQEPLRMVSSYLNLLERRYRDRLDQDAEDFIAFSVDGANRMSAMIEGLLQYSRVETQGAGFEVTDLEQRLAAALDNLQLGIEETGAEIERQPLPSVEADATQMERLFQNLIGNALKFRGAAVPHIGIHVQERGEEWLFSVSDNGIGMAPREADRAFTMFQRLCTREEYPGMGVGLAVCRRIVMRHGGRIWVESRPGEGATFLFTLPRIRAIPPDDGVRERGQAESFGGAA